MAAQPEMARVKDVIGYSPKSMTVTYPECALSNWFVDLLMATFIACGWASAKIYKIGILMFGKKTTFKDLWKWLRQN